MNDREKIASQIGDIERKIADGEALLGRTNRADAIGWFFVAIGLLLIIFLGDVFIIIGLLIIAASIWRFATAAKYRKEIEEGLREYRGRKAEFQAQLMIRE